MEETLADRIEKLLELLQISQRELAKRAGFTTPSQINSTLKRLRSTPGSSVNLNTLHQIADGVGASREWLISGKGEPFEQGAHRGGTRVEHEPGQGHVRFGDQPGYQEAESEARENHSEYPTLVWEETADAMFRSPPEIITAETVATVAKSIFDSMSETKKTKAWADDAKAIAERQDKIRKELKARGLDPKRDPVEWNIEFIKAEAKAKGMNLDEHALDALKSPMPGPVKARVKSKGLTIVI